jgi:hypothetical protein
MRAALLICLSLVACKANPVDKYRADGVAKVGQLAALASKPMPTLAGDTLKAPSGGIRQVSMTAGSTGVYALEALGKPEAAYTTTSAFDTERALRGPFEWVRGKPIDKFAPPQSITESLDALARLRNVFVIKTIGYTKPTIDVDRHSYHPGQYQGEAHLFDLEGHYYGGVRFRAASAATVSYTKWVDKSGAERASSASAEVEYDLKNAAFEAFAKAVAAAVPGSAFMPPR